MARPSGVVAGLLLAVSFALSGCSGSNKNSPTTTSTSTSGHSASTGSTGADATTTTSSAQSLSCTLAPVSEVNSSLGLNVQPPSSQVEGPTTVCTYTGTPGPVIVRFQTGMDASSFASGEQSFQHSGQPTTQVSGLGDAAYSSTIGSGETQTNTIVVLKGSVELLVTAPVSIDDVDALARQILPSI